MRKLFWAWSLLGLALSGCQQANTPPGYGVRVSYAAGQPLAFPDFNLEFLGKRRESSPEFPRGFTFYDFQVSRGPSERLTVSWSSGTGDIGPTLFEFNGRDYRLELAYSDELGRLEEDELVIWQEMR